MTSATQFLHIDQPFTMKKGGVLQSFTLAYETWGKLNAERSNAVLILTGLSPSAHVASSKADPSEGCVLHFEPLGRRLTQWCRRGREMSDANFLPDRVVRNNGFLAISIGYLKPDTAILGHGPVHQAGNAIRSSLE